MTPEQIKEAAEIVCLQRDENPDDTMDRTTLTNRDFAESEVRRVYARLQVELAIKKVMVRAQETKEPCNETES